MAILYQDEIKTIVRRWPENCVSSSTLNARQAQSNNI